MLKETVTGVLVLSTEHDNVCKGCVLGKYAKATFLEVTTERKAYWD